MRRALRVAALLALVALAVAFVFRDWVAAQARAAVVLAAVADAPVLTDVAELVTRDPRAREQFVAGVPTTVITPGGGEAAPAVVFLNGVTRRGRFHPTVRRLTLALARSGYVVYVPDPRGLASGELSTETVDDTNAVVREAVRAHGAVALYGVSGGGTLALLAASRDELRERVRVVAAIAPYADLVDVVRLATTGKHEVGNRLLEHETEPFVALVTARSLAAALPSPRDRRTFLAQLRTIDDASRDPLGDLRLRTSQLGRDGRALLALLRNRDAGRFDELWARLPESIRRTSTTLSPIERASRIVAPIELVSAPHDKYFPVAQSRELVRAAPRARLTISRTLQHADLELTPRQLADLARLDAAIVRSLEFARR